MAVAVSGIVGKLEEFSIASYVERAQLFFETNSVADEKKVAVFLSTIGSKTYALLRNLLAPTLPRVKTFDQLVTALKEHYEPKHLMIAERFIFHLRQQGKTETVSEYGGSLRSTVNSVLTWRRRSEIVLCAG